jgi:Superfamily II DNA/RNA helicases, SNF2 family
MEKVSQEGLQTIIIDEAQRIHNEKTGGYAKLSELIKSKRDIEGFRAVCVTGTPFENNVNELYVLIELVTKVSNDCRTNMDTLQLNLAQIKKQLMALQTREFSNPTAQEFDFLDRLVVKGFHYFSQFGDFARSRLTQLKRGDQSVQAAWGGRVPRRVDISINHQLTPEQLKEMEGIAQKYINVLQMQSVSCNYLIRNKITSKAILFHDLFKKEILKASENGFGNKFIIIVDTAEARQHFKTEILGDKFKAEVHPKVNVFEYHGLQTLKVRNDVLDDFKIKRVEPSILLLMEQAGGVGLNIPEASLMAVASNPFNPGVFEQAVSRIIRVNQVGVKTILRVNYMETYYSEHSISIRKRKEILEQLLLGRFTSETARFRVWVQFLKQELYHDCLNESKNYKIAKDKVKPIEEYLEQLHIEYLRFKTEAEATETPADEPSFMDFETPAAPVMQTSFALDNVTSGQDTDAHNPMDFEFQLPDLLHSSAGNFFQEKPGLGEIKTDFEGIFSEAVDGFGIPLDDLFGELSNSNHF